MGFDVSLFLIFKKIKLSKLANTLFNLYEHLFILLYEIVYKEGHTMKN